MRTGNLRHKISLQEAVRSNDGGGGANETWRTVANAWANVEPLSGRRLVEAQKLEGQITHRVTLRWRNDVRLSMRILFDDRVLNIDSLINVGERRRRIVCMCGERVET